MEGWSERRVEAGPLSIPADVHFLHAVCLLCSARRCDVCAFFCFAQTRSARADISASQLRLCDVAKPVFVFVVASRKAIAFTRLRCAVKWSCWTRRALLFRSRLFLISISLKASILAQWHQASKATFSRLSRHSRHAPPLPSGICFRAHGSRFNNMYMNMFFKCYKIRCLRFSYSYS